MAVGLQTGPIFSLIGTGSFLYCFFSTVCYNLENSNWGSQYPYIMNDLYQNQLLPENIEKAELELESIYLAFTKYSIDKVVWSMEDLSQNPPWANNIADRITNLSNYFYTSDGKDLFQVFRQSMNTAKEINKPLLIRNL